MNQIRAIAFNTFKEAVRNRILYVILCFALLMIGASGVISELTISDREKIIKDLGFMSINLFGIALAVFVGVTVIYNELEKRSIYTIVSKPIARWQFLLGKFLGLLMTIYVNLLIMSIFFLFMLHYTAGMAARESTWWIVVVSSIGKAFVNLFAWGAYDVTRNVMWVILATMVELAMVTAFAIFYSSFTTPTLSMFFTILTFIAGRLNADIVAYAHSVAGKAVKAGEAIPMGYYLAKGVAHIVPNLQIFQITVTQAIYEEHVDIWWQSFAYAICYCLGVLFLSMLIFSRRNFK